MTASLEDTARVRPRSPSGGLRQEVLVNDAVQRIAHFAKT